MTDRSYLRLTEQEFTSLPADVLVRNKSLHYETFLNNCVTLQIVLQTIFSLLLAVFGVTMIAGEFKEIRSNIDLQKKYPPSLPLNIFMPITIYIISLQDLEESKQSSILLHF